MMRRSCKRGATSAASKTASMMVVEASLIMSTGCVRNTKPRLVSTAALTRGCTLKPCSLMSKVNVSSAIEAGVTWSMAVFASTHPREVSESDDRPQKKWRGLPRLSRRTSSKRPCSHNSADM